MVELDLHFLSCFHGIMLNYLMTETILHFTLSKNLKSLSCTKLQLDLLFYMGVSPFQRCF
jgi:hypothetical protein